MACRAWLAVFERAEKGVAAMHGNGVQVQTDGPAESAQKRTNWSPDKEPEKKARDGREALALETKSKN